MQNVRNGVLQNVRESEYGTTLELRNLSATRWSARADSIRAVWSSFDEIIQALEELENSDDTKTRAKAETPQEDQVFRIYFDVNVYEKHDENKNTDKASPEC